MREGVVSYLMPAPVDLGPLLGMQCDRAYCSEVEGAFDSSGIKDRRLEEL